MKWLPPPQDRRVMLAIARIQSNTDFRVLKDHLYVCRKGLIENVKDKKDGVELRWLQGRLQVLDDLEDLFDNAHTWAADMESLELKQKHLKT